MVVISSHRVKRRRFPAPRKDGQAWTKEDRDRAGNYFSMFSAIGAVVVRDGDGTGQRPVPPGQPTTMEHDPTQIKRGENSEDAAAPEEQERSLVAQEHSPTLMTSDQPGTGGHVRIWAPSNWPYRTMLIASYALLVLVIVIGLHGAYVSPHLWLSFIMSCGLVVMVRDGVRRRRYVAADTNGIAVTTVKGCCALRWDEIDWMQTAAEGVTLGGSDPRRKVEIELTGFTLRQRRDLRETIGRNANLVPPPYYNQGHWKRISPIDKPGARR